VAKLRDIPEGPLRELAASIPAGILGAWDAWEAWARVAEASSLLGVAGHMSPDEAGKARAKADRLLTGMPVEAYVSKLRELNAALWAASAREDDELAGRIYAQIHKHIRLNPVPEEILRLAMPATASEVDALGREPSRVIGVRK
jgi:hypothetical protein